VHISFDCSGLCSGLTTHTDPTGASWCVVVIKGTYEVQDGRMVPSEAQQPLETVDRYTSEPGASSLRCENDFAPHKPMIDVVVHGHAFGPERRSCESCVVELRVGDACKRVRVHGHRVWRPGVLGLVPSAALTFERQALTWELAYGGTTAAGCELQNPVGAGLADGVSERAAVGTPAPSIESVDAPIERWGRRHVPVGLAPIARGWHPRLAAAGTFDESWCRDRFPLLPTDFSYAHFNIAPEDQRHAELAPGTRIAAVNMSPTGLFVAEVPPPPPAIQFHFADGMVERVAVLDTLVLEPEAGRLLASWRAHVLLGRKPSRLREITIGRPNRVIGPTPQTKPHFRSLGEFVNWAKQRRGAARR
jgi:hypothetical protein